MERYRTIIASRNRLFRLRVRRMLEAQGALDQAAEVWEGFGLLEHVRHDPKGPLMCILEAPFPTIPWPEAVAKIKRDRPEAGVLVVGAFDDPEYIATAIDAGADGYVVKEDVERELMRAIETVLEGETYVPAGRAELRLVRPAVSAG